MKRKERKEKVAQMTNPVHQILGCGFFDWFFFLPFFECFAFFLLPDFWVFYYYYYFLFPFVLFLVLFMLSLCFWRHHLFPLCYQELSRKVNMSATTSPSVLCGHLLTEGNRCRLSKDQSCLRFPASPLPSGSGFLPTSPQTPPQCTPFFLPPPPPLFLFWCSTRDICSVTGLQSLGWKEVANCWSETFTLGNFCPHRWTQPGGGGCGEGDGCSGSTVFHESRAHSHQKPARSNSKLSVEPRQYWGASSRDFLNLLFLPTTFSFSFAPFFYIYMYICVYIYL